MGQACSDHRIPDEEGHSRIKYLLDAHIARGSEWITGADAADKHVFHAVYGRDFEADGFVEAVEVRTGDMSLMVQIRSAWSAA